MLPIIPFLSQRTLNKHKPRRNDGRPLTGPSCAVCEEEAPDGQQFRKHYGVICCEACKCFFRRTVQMGKRYECKLSRDCPVGKNVRHWCQSCRFQKCCNSGMKREGSIICNSISILQLCPYSSPEDGISSLYTSQVIIVTMMFCESLLLQCTSRLYCPRNFMYQKFQGVSL